MARSVRRAASGFGAPHSDTRPTDGNGPADGDRPADGDTCAADADPGSTNSDTSSANRYAQATHGLGHACRA